MTDSFADMLLKASAKHGVPVPTPKIPTSPRAALPAATTTPSSFFSGYGMDAKPVREATSEVEAEFEREFSSIPITEIYERVGGVLEPGYRVAPSGSLPVRCVVRLFAVLVGSVGFGAVSGG